MNVYLLLWLEAPLQSWGADSKFGRRDTLPFPTKSGISGMLLCAMGASGPQNELLAELNNGALEIRSYSKKRVSRDGKTVEHALREPHLKDFHMVGSGYDEKDTWQKMLIPKTREGKPAVGGGSKLTYRYYLQDAYFAALLEVTEELAESIVNGLINPVFDIYFGRKNCVPTEKIYQGTYHQPEDAWSAAESIAEGKGLVEQFRVLEGEHEGDSMTLNDVPVQFGEVKKYRDRRVTVLQS